MGEGGAGGGKRWRGRGEVGCYRGLGSIVRAFREVVMVVCRHYLCLSALLAGKCFFLSS